MPSSTNDRARKIRALLDKAEATSYPAEAEALTAKASELMAQWQITDAMLASARPATDRGEIITRDVELGKGPYLNARLALLGAAGEFQRCRVLTSTGWNGRIGHLVGFSTDVERAEMLYTSLMVQATTAVAAAPGPSPKSSLSTTSWRRNFLLGYARTTSERLRHVQEDATSGSSSVALVLADRAVAVDEWVAQSYGRLGSMRAARASSNAGWDHGRVAGSSADLGSGGRISGRARTLTR